MENAVGGDGDPYRWVVLCIFCCYSSSNAIQWVTYSSIAAMTKVYFELNTSELNMLSLVYMIVFVVGVFFTCTTFEQWGVRRGLLIGGGLNALGGVLKVAPGVLYPRYATIITPQTIGALAQLFVLSTPPLIAAQYFRPHKRAFATAIMSTSNNIGNALALFVPPFIVVKGERSEFMLLSCLVMGYSVLVFGAIIFFARPPRYLSPSAALLGTDAHADERDLASCSYLGQDVASLQKQLGVVNGVEPMEGNMDEADDPEPLDDSLPPTSNRTDVGRVAHSGGTAKPQRGSFWRRMRANQHVSTFVEVARTIVLLMKKRDFLFLMIAFSISMGSVWTFLSVLAQILEPFGLTPELAGIAGALNVVVGVITAYIVGIVVDRKRRYKVPVLICLSGTVVCCAALIAVMLRVPPHTSLMTGLSMFLYIFAGVFQHTATPISFEFAMEITFPMTESVPGALLMAGANLVSLVLLVIATAMLGNGEPDKMSAVYVVVLITCVCVVGTIFAAFPRERLHRLTAELVALETVRASDVTGALSDHINAGANEADETQRESGSRVSRQSADEHAEQKVLRESAITSRAVPPPETDAAFSHQDQRSEI